LGDHEITRKGIRVGIVPNKGSYRIWMNGQESNTDYPSLTDAKLKAYETIESGEAQAYLEKQKLKDEIRIAEQRRRATFNRRWRTTGR
jgi:hypothetical protein